jgi:ribosomal-protein-alanine N-acetyltransferase
VIELHSKRLSFRELQPADVTQEYIGWLNDSKINQYLETRFYPQNEISVRDFIERQLNSPDDFLFRISLLSNDQHIGNIKLGPLNHHHATAQLSLLIGEPSMHRKGYATESIARVTRWGFEQRGLHRIEAGCYANNLASLRAFLKVGYSVEGFRREAVVTASGARVGAFWFACLAGDKLGKK